MYENLFRNPAFLIKLVYNLVPSVFLDAKAKDFRPSKPSLSWNFQLRIVLFLYIRFLIWFELVHDFRLKIWADSLFTVVQVCCLISSDQETVHGE